MSKKSRKRNRRLLKAAALIGGLAMMGRRKGTPAADVDSGRGGDSSSAAARVAANAPAPVTGTVYPGSNRRKKWISTNPLASSKWNKMDVSEVTIPTPKIAAPKNVMHPTLTQRRTRPVKDVFTDSGVPWWGQGAKDGGRIGKRSGGKVKLAKRGFGRAFTKAKK